MHSTWWYHRNCGTRWCHQNAIFKKRHSICCPGSILNQSIQFISRQVKGTPFFTVKPTINKILYLSRLCRGVLSQQVQHCFVVAIYHCDINSYQSYLIHQKLSEPQVNKVQFHTREFFGCNFLYFSITYNLCSSQWLLPSFFSPHINSLNGSLGKHQFVLTGSKGHIRQLWFISRFLLILF